MKDNVKESEAAYAYLAFPQGTTKHKAVNHSIKVPESPTDKTANQKITIAGEVKVGETGQKYFYMVGSIIYSADKNAWIASCRLEDDEGKVIDHKKLDLDNNTLSVDFTSAIKPVNEKQSSTMERLYCAATTQPKQDKIELYSEEEAKLGIFEIEQVKILNINDNVQSCLQLPNADKLIVGKITPYAPPGDWDKVIIKDDCGRKIDVAEVEKSNVVTIHQNPS